MTASPRDLPTPDVPATVEGVINGRWDVLGRVGGGTQGEVLAVRDRQTAEELVLKTVRGGRAALGEFAHLARLADPALPRVHDLAIAEDGPIAAGTVFFTAERVAGVPLLVAAAATPHDQLGRLIWSVGRDVAGALAVLHAAGLLHHDVTPANVLVVGSGAATRGVLVDLGLATAGPAATARGTPAYLAPEALAGDAEARSDLYSLGATLHHAASGAPPFAGPDLGATITAILTRRAPPLASWIGGALISMIHRLLEKRPGDRYASAVALARDLDEIAAAVDAAVRPRPRIAVRATLSPPSLVGADAAIAAIATVLDTAAEGREVAPLWLTGPHGVLAGEVVAEAVRRHQLARASRGAPPLAVTRGALDDVAQSLGVAGAERVAGAVVSAAHRTGRAALVDVTGDERADALAAALAAAGVAAAAIVAWCETDTPPATPGLQVIRLEPVTELQILRIASEMLGVHVPRPWANALHAAAGGLPGVAAEIVRLAASRGGDPIAVDPATIAPEADGVAAIAAARAEALDPEARAVVRATAIRADGRALLAAVLAAGDAAALGRAVAAGIARRDGDEVVVDPRVAAAIVAHLDPAQRRALHRDALAATPALDVVARAEHLAGAGDPQAPASALEAAEVLLGRGALRRARALAEVAAGDADPALAARGAVLVARAATLLGDYRGARARALAAAPSLPAAAAAAARLVAARAAQRAGDLDTADAELGGLAVEVDRLIAGGAELGDLRAEVLGARARLLVARGRHDEALAATAAAGDVRGPASHLLLEAAGLAAFYRGDLDAAEARFAALEREATDAGPALAGRAAALAAMVSLQRGDLAAASVRQRAAGEAARAAGDFHAAAVADLNLATTLAERGRHGEALPVLARAIAALDALGARGERAAAEFNRGTALLAVGDVDGAETAARAALSLGDGDVAVYAGLLLGDVARRRGDDAAAHDVYDTALDRAGGGHARLCALAAIAELVLAAGDAAAARPLIDEAAPLASAPDDLARIAALRAALAQLDGNDRDAAVDAATRAARAALAAGRADRAWRTLLVAAETAHAAGRVDAATLAGDAAEIRRGIVAATPDAWGARIDDDPDGRRLAALIAALDADEERAPSTSRGGAARADRGAPAPDAQAAWRERAAGSDDAARRDRAGPASGLDAARGDRTSPASDLGVGRSDRATPTSDLHAARPDRATPASDLDAAHPDPMTSRDPLDPASDGGPVSAAPAARGARAAHADRGAPAPPDSHRAPARAARPRSSMLHDELSAPTPALLEIARLRRLLALSRRLNGEPDLDRLLDDVIDAAIEMTEAERGFLLLRPSPGHPLEVVVARNFALGSLDDAGGKISRSIAERAAATGEPVITVDAGVDERFGDATSVAALRLRSVMAVPLRQKGHVTGCIYVDHRLRDGAFDDRAAGLALDLADIAAVAIENTRLATDLRRRQEENDALAARLAAELDDRDAELTRVRAQLGDAPARAALVGHYDAIIGESPAILSMLSVVDRAARTELPVVIVGESGTGKELVARALHDHGARKDRGFVAVNCSAMPEPLLESELFGHVRGAFTGADRDRRGLFEVADGGTLFLDEVADTTPAMQAKLLRILQDGQVRRLGDDRTRTVDVRIVAASQHPLGELVSAGRFREDLRFRLEVIPIGVPPLRERLEDIATLIEHFLDHLAPKLAGRARPSLTRAALRALQSHTWPGNVRELENAIARACALGGPVIDVEDLPEAVAHARLASPSPSGPGADLTLKPALDALERAYLDAALARAGGNQTVAARLLGLSRFGLQKKLKRLAE